MGQPQALIANCASPDQDNQIRGKTALSEVSLHAFSALLDFDRCKSVQWLSSRSQSDLVWSKSSSGRSRTSLKAPVPVRKPQLYLFQRI
eukprot:320552-Chlamydomonas_euryale.AAC.6